MQTALHQSCEDPTSRPFSHLQVPAPTFPTISTTTRNKVTFNFGFTEAEYSSNEAMIHMLAAILVELKGNDTVEPTAKQLLEAAIKKDMEIYILRKELQDIDDPTEKETTMLILKEIMSEFVSLTYRLFSNYSLNYYSIRRDLAAKVASDEEKETINGMLPVTPDTDITEMAVNSKIITLM